MTFETTDRWSGNERECPYCGSLLGARVRCRRCEDGEHVAPVTEAVTETGTATYPPLDLSPEELAAHRKQCRTFDEQQSEEARRTYDTRSGAADYCPVYPRITEEEERNAMPMMDEVYGGNTLKAEDVPPNFRAVLTVDRVAVQLFEDKRDKNVTEKKLVLYFTGKDKGLTLNITNANMMAEIAHNRDYDYWPGKSVVLFRTMTDFGGKRVPALRLDHLPKGSVPAPVPQPPPPVREPVMVGGGFQASDDDVPF